MPVHCDALPSIEEKIPVKSNFRLQVFVLICSVNCAKRLFFLNASLRQPYVLSIAINVLLEYLNLNC